MSSSNFNGYGYGVIKTQPYSSAEDTIDEYSTNSTAYGWIYIPLPFSGENSSYLYIQGSFGYYGSCDIRLNAVVYATSAYNTDKQYVAYINFYSYLNSLGYLSGMKLYCDYAHTTKMSLLVKSYS